jgi:hypothetical protein
MENAVVDPRADVDTAGVRTTFLTAFDHAVSDAFMVPSHSDDGVRASVPGRIFRNRGWARHDAAPKAGRTAAAAQPAWHASNRRGDGGGGGGGGGGDTYTRTVHPHCDAHSPRHASATASARAAERLIRCGGGQFPTATVF